MVPMLKLEELEVFGPSSSQDLVTLLCLGLNLRIIRLGQSWQVTDATVEEVRQAMESFLFFPMCWRQTPYTNWSVCSCPRLSCLLGLSSWGGLKEQELCGLREQVQGCRSCMSVLQVRRDNMVLELGQDGCREDVEVSKLIGTFHG